MQVVSLKQMQRLVAETGDPSCSVLDVLDARYGEQWVYIGRKVTLRDGTTLEASPLGNPHRLNGRERGAVIQPYRCWLWAHLQVANSPQVTAIRELSTESVLICWCDQPDPCHGHVVAAAWAHLQTPAGAWLAAENRVIVAGTRSYTDEVGLFQELNRYLPTLTGTVAILSGGARGADCLGEWYAVQQQLPVKRFPAKWERDGKQAGFLRNTRMADVATHLVAFWDGQSAGTRHMIETARARSISTHVVSIS